MTCGSGLLAKIMVVGSSLGNDRFLQREDLKTAISYEQLSTIKNDFGLLRLIHKVLREAGIRYCSADIKKCHKSKALVHNYKFITSYEGGFEGLLREISKIKGPSAEISRVRFLMQHFKYIKNKSARDFLMSMGINRNTLALDIRIQNIFRHFGIDFPSQIELARSKIYDTTEQEIIKKICSPLNIEPVKFDRILYKNYKSIINT